MGTRNIGELAEEVRFNTNSTDDSRFTDERLIKFFNSAQRQVQKIIYTSNMENSPFVKEEEITIEIGTSQYDLPEDIFSLSAIQDVSPRAAGGPYLKPLRQITIKDRDKDYGYYIIRNSINLAPSTLVNSYQAIVITYTYKLEDFTSFSDESELPASTEDYLMAFVERKINYVDSSKDISASSVFTAEEKQEIVSLVSNISKDIKFPTISNDSYMNL